MMKKKVDYYSFCGDMTMLLNSHGVFLSSMDDRKKEKEKARLESYMISCADKPYSKTYRVRFKSFILVIRGIDEAAYLHRLL